MLLCFWAILCKPVSLLVSFPFIQSRLKSLEVHAGIHLLYTIYNGPWISGLMQIQTSPTSYMTFCSSFAQLHIIYYHFQQMCMLNISLVSTTNLHALSPMELLACPLWTLTPPSGWPSSLHWSLVATFVWVHVFPCYAGSQKLNLWFRISLLPSFVQLYGSFPVGSKGQALSIAWFYAFVWCSHWYFVNIQFHRISFVDWILTSSATIIIVILLASTFALLSIVLYITGCITISL